MKKILLLIAVLISFVLITNAWSGDVKFLPKQSAGSLSVSNRNIIVGNSSGYGASVPLSGDATITSAGVVSVVGISSASTAIFLPDNVDVSMGNTKANPDWRFRVDSADSDAFTFYEGNTEVIQINKTTNTMFFKPAGAEKLRIGTTGISFSTAAVPLISDGAALGGTSNMWSDLFLASGGVINMNNGDITLTQSADLLTLAGGGLTLTSGPTIFNEAGANVDFRVEAPSFDHAAFLDASEMEFGVAFNGVPTLTAKLDVNGTARIRGMLVGNQGTNITVASDATLTATGNFFTLSGSGTMNTLSVPTNTMAGTVLILSATGTTNVAHAVSGTGASFQLAGSTTYTMTPTDVLEVYYNGTYWKEKSRTVF